MQRSSARIAGSLAVLGVTAISALGTLGCVIPGQNHFQQPMAAPQQAAFETSQWQTIRRDDASLSFEMPSTPTEESTASRLTDGRRSTRTFGSTRSRGALFGYVVLSFEEGIAGYLLSELDELVDGTIEAAEGSEVESAEALWLGGYPGTELRLTNAEDRVTIRMRHYIGRSRAYIFFVTIPTGTDEEMRSGIDRFFGSIALDPFDAPSVNGSGTFETSNPVWRYVSPPEGGFAIELPAEPRRANESISVDGHDLDVYTYFLADRAPAIDIRVSTITLRPRERDGLIAALETWLLAFGGTISRTEHGARGGYPMRRLEIVSGDRTRHAMIVFATQVVHVIQISGVPADEAALGPMRERIFASFIRP